ncbi:MAG: hypothetical protein EPN93_19810 [Spirochaetes bacterium]|nr:MAG: hypothetical protein EPN93_19810 [Spirochaetota bacterium]
MVEIAPRRCDHVLLRQVLAAALLAEREVLVRGGAAFIDSTPEVQPLVSDWEKFIDSFRLGAFDINGDDLVFTPGQVRHGIYSFETNPYSSAVELALLMAPALSARPYRSALDLRGVTHAAHSYATDFVRETLFALFEPMGFYTSLSLRRFGFYGTGKGEMEVKVFPSRSRQAGSIIPACVPRVTGARVYISRYPSTLAYEQKDILSGDLGLDPATVGIMEIMNAAGSGNALHAHLDWGGIDVLLPHVIDAYSFDGSRVADEAALCDAVRVFANFVRGVVADGVLPAVVVRELVPYAVMTGSRLPDSGDPDAVEESLAVMRALLG